MSLLNIRVHIMTVPACSSGTLTSVLPHRNVMPQTQDMTPHPVTVYRHGAELSLCYPLMWDITLEYTATHFNVLGQTRPGIFPRPSTHTSEVVVSQKLSRAASHAYWYVTTMLRYDSYINLKLNRAYNFLWNISQDFAFLYFMT